MFPQAGLGEVDTVNKMNTLLASAAAKSFTNRPTQYELKAMQAANPGMMNSKAGTLALLNILKQSAQQDVELGQLAQRANPNNWASQRDLYYARASVALTVHQQAAAAAAGPGQRQDPGRLQQLGQEFSSGEERSDPHA